MKKDDEADDEAWLMVAMVAEIDNENNVTTKMAAMVSPDDSRPEVG